MRSYLSDRSSTFAFAKEIGAYKEGLIDDFECASAYYKNVKDSSKEKIINGILSLINAEVGYYVDNVDYAGKGSWDVIVPKFQKLVESRGGKDYYMRGTFTHHNPDFLEDIKTCIAIFRI